MDSAHKHASDETSAIPLTVAELHAHDAGRGLARMDPADMERIGVSSGDVILIAGKRTTAARVIPAHPHERGRSTIQTDGITRLNAGTRLGDHVRVKAGPAQRGERVVLHVNGELAPDLQEIVRRNMGGLPVLADDRIRMRWWGSRSVDLRVEKTVPAGVVIVDPHTQIVWRVAAPIADGDGVTYDDVGGLGPAVQRVREVVELPLRYPEVFQHLGITPLKGILLTGPPGTGKTLLARTIASETEATFLLMNGPEIMHKYYGESEAHLRQLFERARQAAPSIIFLDEIDVIAPKRGEVHGDLEKRVVGQLLVLMDGLDSNGQVIIIGATNRPDALDPALRRPGRFDREISIQAPTEAGRLEILEIHTRGMPLDPNVALDGVAAQTHGYVGADLAALCREAALIALSDFLPAAHEHGGAIPLALVKRLTVTQQHFLNAMDTIGPSALREVLTEVPNIAWDQVGGLEDAKTLLQQTVILPFQHPEVCTQLGAELPRGVLFSGPPGTGKTLLAEALATCLGLNMISIRGPELLSKYVGESEAAVRDIFLKSRQTAPCLLFFDEFDALAPERSGHSNSRAEDRVVGQLLTEMDGIRELRNVLVLAATNRPDIIDPAIRRSGRFDVLVECALPNPDGVRQILAIHTAKRPLNPDVDLDTLGEMMNGLSGADIAAICRLAAMQALARYIQAPPSAGRPPEISAQDFQTALLHRRDPTGLAVRGVSGAQVTAPVSKP